MPAGLASDSTRGLQCVYVLLLDISSYSSVTRAAVLPYHASKRGVILLTCINSSTLGYLPASCLHSPSMLHISSMRCCLVSQFPIRPDPAAPGCIAWHGPLDLYGMVMAAHYMFGYV